MWHGEVVPEREAVVQHRRWITIGFAALVASACGDSTGVTVEDLVGTWNATMYRYTDNANAAQQIDLIAQGASFTMTVTAGGTVSTLFDDGQGGTSSDSGTLSPDGTTLTIAGNAYEAQRSGDVLTLTDETSAYDIDDNGSDESATLVIRLARQ
jgi:hypothetical protein